MPGQGVEPRLGQAPGRPELQLQTLDVPLLATELDPVGDAASFMLVYQSGTSCTETGAFAGRRMQPSLTGRPMSRRRGGLAAVDRRPGVLLDAVFVR